MQPGTRRYNDPAIRRSDHNTGTCQRQRRRLRHSARALRCLNLFYHSGEAVDGAQWSPSADGLKLEDKYPRKSIMGENARHRKDLRPLKESLVKIYRRAIFTENNWKDFGLRSSKLYSIWIETGSRNYWTIILTKYLNILRSLFGDTSRRLSNLTTLRTSTSLSDFSLNLS